MTTFKLDTFDVQRFDDILAKGLSQGVGSRTGTMCIEAAICTVLDLPHGDDPGCVARSVRSFKITLNDKQWSSPIARAKGLRDLGLAQLGSLGVVDDKQFNSRLSEKIIRQLIPHLFRSYHRSDFDAVALRCEQEGTRQAALEARRVAAAAYVAYAAYAAYAAAAYAAAAVAYAAAYAAYAAKSTPDFYLILAAELALDTLRELNSPGIILLNEKRTA